MSETPRGTAAARDHAEPAVQAVWRALDTVMDPEIRKPITDLGMVTRVSVDAAGGADVRVLLTIAGCPAARKIEAETNAAVAGAAGVTESRVEIGVMTPTERAAFVKRVRGNKGVRAPQFGPESLT
jgi:ATP-binding protein involved in chromosome partitioning